MSTQEFRAGVALVVRRSDGKVLVCERSDNPGSWQLPQGGIDVGETPLQAAWRELEEEVGLAKSDVLLIGEVSDWFVYEWPDSIRRSSKHGERRRGQAMRWFVFRVLDEDSCRVRVDGEEFTNWKWMTVDDLVDDVVGFRRDSYRRAFRAIDSDLLEP